MIDSSLALDRLHFHICRSEKKVNESRSEQASISYFCIGVAELNCDIPDKLVLKPHSHYARNCLYHR
jgi:hypothetical protein